MFVRSSRNAIARSRPKYDSAALWSGTNKNRDVSIGPLARPFARLLALLTLFTCFGLLASLAPSTALTHFAHSLTRGTMYSVQFTSCFFPLSSIVFCRLTFEVPLSLLIWTIILLPMAKMTCSFHPQTEISLAWPPKSCCIPEEKRPRVDIR